MLNKLLSYIDKFFDKAEELHLKAPKEIQQLVIVAGMSSLVQAAIYLGIFLVKLVV